VNSRNIKSADAFKEFHYFTFTDEIFASEHVRFWGNSTLKITF